MTIDRNTHVLLDALTDALVKAEREMQARLDAKYRELSLEIREELATLKRERQRLAEQVEEARQLRVVGGRR